MTIVEAIQHKKLFRPLFGGDLASWSSWMTFLRSLFGLQMTPEEADLYRRATGRTDAPTRQFREGWVRCGRRGGKSWIASVIAVYVALFVSFKQYLAVGERGVVMLVAADREQARVLLNYVRGILRSSKVFERYVQADLKEGIGLSTGIDISVMTCDFRSIRGRTCVLFIGDEACFWRSEGRNNAGEVISAIRPAMATIPTAMLLMISSPYSMSGVFYETDKAYFGKDDPEVLVWAAPTRVMNPRISEQFIESERKKDPSAARSEWDAEWRDDIESLLSVDAIDAVIRPGGNLAPDPFLQYVAFCDPSGGRGDAFTLAVAHQEPDRCVIDHLSAWWPPFDPSEVCAAIAGILKEYRLTQLTGDRYAGVWVPSTFEKAGVSYTTSPLVKSDLYLAFEAQVNQRKVELPDDRELVSQLRSLERKKGRQGKDSVDHPPRGRDDLANSVAGAAYLAQGLGTVAGEVAVSYGSGGGDWISAGRW